MSTKPSVFIMLTIVVILTTSWVVSESSEVVSCKDNPRGSYPDPESCSGFYVCAPNHALFKACPNGLYFHNKIQTCDYPKNVKCTKKPRRWESISTTKCHKLVCYYLSRLRYRRGAGTIWPEDIEADMCTDIVYSYAVLRGNRIVTARPHDEGLNGKPGDYARVLALKYNKPHLNVLLRVAGGYSQDAPFRAMVTNSTTRREFIDNSIKYLRHHEFDGLELHWRFPMGVKDKFSNLLREMKAAFVEEGKKTGRPRLIMAAALGSWIGIVHASYDVPVLSSELDYMYMIGHDFTGPWRSITGHHSHISSVQRAANYLVKKGVKKEKLLISLPLYGRSFRLASASKNAESSPAKGKARAGAFSKMHGYLTYYEVCEFIKKGATVRKENSATYAFYKDQWISYDTSRSLRAKIDYIVDSGFGGVWVLDVGEDDRTGRFCGEGRFPLIKSIHQACHAHPL